MPLTAYASGGIFAVSWEVEYTEEFGGWWSTLDEKEQISVDASVRLLERYGPMRELRVQHGGRPLRVLYAFDPRRTAVLLLGGDKTGNRRWYEESVPRADALYDRHLSDVMRGGGTNG
jgi:hypothetical protein